MSANSNLFELTTNTNKMIVGAMHAATRRNVAYAQTFWSIVAAPYSGDDISTNLSEGFERLGKLGDLTIAQIETANAKAIEFSENLLATADKAREESVSVARSFAKNGVDGMKSAMESTEERFVEISKQFEKTIA